MRSKGHQGKYSLIVLFVGIFAFWWGIAVLAQNDKTAYTAPQTASAASPAGAYISQTIAGPVAIQATVKGGTVYTYSGSIPLTDICEELGTGIAVNGSNPQHVTIVLTLKEPVAGCAQASGGDTLQPFAVFLSVAPGTKALLDGLTVNGAIVETTVAKTVTN